MPRQYLRKARSVEGLRNVDGSVTVTPKGKAYDDAITMSNMVYIVWEPVGSDSMDDPPSFEVKVGKDVARRLLRDLREKNLIPVLRMREQGHQNYQVEIRAYSENDMLLVRLLAHQSKVDGDANETG